MVSNKAARDVCMTCWMPVHAFLCGSVPGKFLIKKLLSCNLQKTRNLRKKAVSF